MIVVRSGYIRYVGFIKKSKLPNVSLKLHLTPSLTPQVGGTMSPKMTFHFGNSQYVYVQQL